MTEFDYVLVGGGLQNGLIAGALRMRQPESRIALVERAGALGGNHTWCFHEADVAPDSRDWLEPLVVHAWPGYRVVFPNLQRTIDGRYSAVTSERLDEVASAAVRGGPGSKLFLNTEVSEVGTHVVTLSSGGRLEGRVVVDSRGPPPPSGRATAGYQKFLGLELELARPHHLDRPVLMDATVDQSEGYRFLYILPLGPSRLLVEDILWTGSNCETRSSAASPPGVGKPRKSCGRRSAYSRCPGQGPRACRPPVPCSEDTAEAGSTPGRGTPSRWPPDWRSSWRAGRRPTCSELTCAGLRMNTFVK